MKRNFVIVFILIGVISCNNAQDKQNITVNSPDDNIRLTFDNSDSKPFYSVKYRQEELLKKSALGFEFLKMAPIDSNLTVVDYETSSVDSSWTQLWGAQKVIKDKHNRLFVTLKEKSGSNRTIQLEFKVFNDGIGFRYIFPKENSADSIKIMDELTEFSFADNHTTWYIPAYNGWKYELLYEETGINNLDTAHTPLTIKTTDGPYVSIHEAALVDFASMTLYGNKNNTLKSDLVPWQDGVKVKANETFKTPWRTIIIGDEPGDLIESNLVLNLNEPNKLGDVSWVKPMKYVGIWWALHIDIWTFHQSDRLGATTEHTMEYIDFAAKQGFDEVLVEGWNAGWPIDGQWGIGTQIYYKPNPRYDMFKVQEYAQSKGVTIQAYNETGANTENYLSQIDSAYALYEELGYRSVKVGHVDEKFKNGEWHHGQFGVNYYKTVLEKGAEHQLAINFHEPIKPTGLRRTYPNLVSQEGARGQEFNAWDAGGNNPPEHLTILPFTRLLAGPMDFTPGIFRVDIPQKPNNRVNTTLAKQLAIYVVIYSPIQMAADLPENYKQFPDAFQFIKDVPVDWETTKVIDGQIADYVTIARKDINSEDWYLGTMTDETSREFDISLDFLDEGTYEAQIYKDSEKTDLENAPMEYKIIKKEVSRQDSIHLNLAQSGGAAIRFKKIQ